MPAMNLDQKALYERAFAEGQAAFLAAISKFPSERFYAFCFYTDNDVTGVYPRAHTHESLKRIYSGSDPQEINYYRWAPAEWSLDFGQYDRPGFMAQTNKLLYPNRESNEQESQESFRERKRQTISTLTQVLFAIREAKTFRNHTEKENIAFWVNIGDADPEERDWMFRPALPRLDQTDIAQLRALYKFR